MGETTYHVDILGELWWGGTAATSRTIRHDEIMELPQADNESDDDYLVRMIECALDTGDFQSVDALHIERETITRTGPRSFETKWTTLQSFTEDDAIAYSDCFSTDFEDTATPSTSSFCWTSPLNSTSGFQPGRVRPSTRTRTTSPVLRPSAHARAP